MRAALLHEDAKTLVIDDVPSPARAGAAVSSTRPAGRVVQVGLAGAAARITALKNAKPRRSPSRYRGGEHP
jgi:threonine dehydrogenase-like Zn-dependent dehydrogenase